MTGIVYLVGAGPGAADLLTVRATRVLDEADIVFHDALIGPDILALAPRAETIAVGKRCGRHATTQLFINKRLADAASRHRVVVRLKGGDPMLFGRAHEEMAHLRRLGVRVEVVPGITAALGAAATLGISLTRRGLSRSLVFATPRVGAGESPSQWADAVAAADTAALYMAGHHATKVRDSLIASGMAATTPVVVAASVSLPAQTLVAGTLGELPSLAAKVEGAPALVLLGDAFADAYALVGDLRAPRMASATA
jgi:uroporphyrin-III C-methyltransferase